MIEIFAPQFISKIQEYQVISVFVHQKPDFDAYASAFGIKVWINDNFPNIKVYLIIPPGTITNSEKGLFNHDEELPHEEQVKNSLGIIVDASDERRILTNLYIRCKELMVIDHHPKISSFAALEFIDPTYPAASQILAELFLYLETDEGGNYLFNNELVKYFYSGIMTDTSNFLSMTMLPSTFNVLSKLVSKGLNRLFIHRFVLDKPLRQKLMEMQILKHCKLTANGLLFAIVTSKIMKKCKLSEDANINPTTVIANVPNVEVWTSLIYDKSTGMWKCSLRSQNISVNQIARLYGGGGHKKMAAVTFSKKSKYYKILATLDKYLEDRNCKNITLADKNKCWQLFLVKLFKNYKKM